MTETTDRLELATQAIYHTIVGKRIGHLFPLRDPNNLPSPSEYTEQQLAICREAAGAVLAALGEAGAILPELPETVSIVHVITCSPPGQPDRWCACVQGDYGEDEDGTCRYRLERVGTGPTPTDAIRNALEGAE